MDIAKQFLDEKTMYEQKIRRCDAAISIENRVFRVCLYLLIPLILLLILPISLSWLVDLVFSAYIIACAICGIFRQVCNLIKSHALNKLHAVEWEIQREQVLQEAEERRRQQ